jgi:hypothetical protein
MRSECCQNKKVNFQVRKKLRARLFRKTVVNVLQTNAAIQTGNNDVEVAAFGRFKHKPENEVTNEEINDENESEKMQIKNEFVFICAFKKLVNHLELHH